MMGGGDAGWALVSLLIFLAVALTVAWALTGSAGAPHTAGQILNERLARRRHHPEQYRAMRATLVRTIQAPSRTPRGALLVAAAVPVAGVVLVGVSAGTSGERWPGWMCTMHDARTNVGNPTRRRWTSAAPGHAAAGIRATLTVETAVR